MTIPRWRLPGKYIGVLLMLATACLWKPADCIQCYSCKGSGSNEIDANIHCLESAYLENCEEFYNYYNEVEDGDIEDFDTDDYYEDEYEEDYTIGGNGGRDRSLGPRSRSGQGHQLEVTSAGARDYPESRERGDRSKRSLVKRRRKRAEDSAAEDENYEYDYEYEYEDYDEDDTATSKAKSRNKLITGTKEPKVDQHHCYSTTVKNGWESYTVEKGCKKIPYCKEALENKPEWAHPWNFCCDRSRCNVKLVKDKPQRVFGMGCRRTDDCIQGHNSRSVCLNFFKSCPRISSSIIKMECRVKARTMASVKNSAKYRHMFRDKKCYCAKGYYPAGPICTSSASRNFFINSAFVVSGILIQLTAVRIME